MMISFDPAYAVGRHYRFLLVMCSGSRADDPGDFAAYRSRCRISTALGSAERLTRETASGPGRRTAPEPASRLFYRVMAERCQANRPASGIRPAAGGCYTWLLVRQGTACRL